METAIYAAMHFAVDFLCAWAMFRSFGAGGAGYENLLIYNFCAFALQMPLGTLLDLLQSGGKGNRLPRIWASVGAALTAVGAMVHPALLGLGNALFHVGGGMDVIAADFERDRKGRDLGVFVAPGAIGLYLGTGMGKGTGFDGAVLAGAAVLAILAGMLLRGHAPGAAVPASGSGGILLAVCCFAVVILRSFVGLSVTFPWKTGAFFGALAVVSVAAGKVAGGFLAARFGPDRTIAYSLLLAAGCFLLGDDPAFGLTALFFFNMTMPVTLYLLARKLPRMPGFSFGLLTFGLFLGFLPVYARAEVPVSGAVLGAVSSILSMVILLAGRKVVAQSDASA